MPPRVVWRSEGLSYCRVLARPCSRVHAPTTLALIWVVIFFTIQYCVVKPTVVRAEFSRVYEAVCTLL